LGIRFSSLGKPYWKQQKGAYNLPICESRHNLNKNCCKYMWCVVPLPEKKEKKKEDNSSL